MDLDRQAIERRDFPIGRRGYDPARRRRPPARAGRRGRGASARGRDRRRRDLSLASTAGTQVQAILEAAETAAAEIERTAHGERPPDARRGRRATPSARASRRSRRRARTWRRSRRSTATLLERVGSMDAEVERADRAACAPAPGAWPPTWPLSRAGWRELYGAASGSRGRGAQRRPRRRAAPRRRPPPAPRRAAAAGRRAAAAGPRRGALEAGARLGAGRAGQATAACTRRPSPRRGRRRAGADVDGARLIALNMALNGESRSDTERYLAENFELADRRS